MLQCLELVKKTLNHNSRTVKNAVLEGEKALFQKISADQVRNAVEKVLVEFISTLPKDDGLHESTRAKAAEAMLALAKVAPDGGLLDQTLQETIAFARKNERSYSVQQILQQAKGILLEKT